MCCKLVDKGQFIVADGGEIGAGAKGLTLWWEVEITRSTRVD